MINERISEIGDGRYVDIIKEVYERESSRQTMCAGVHWDYELEDLLQVAEVIIARRGKTFSRRNVG